MHAASLVRMGVFLAAALLVPLQAQAAGAIPLPNDGKIEKVDFERHVMGLFGRLGCNTGSCHGSFQGKGNFRLSLFGYDPDLDYESITRDGGGRRLSASDPDKSLLLLKATGQIDHGGMRRMSKDSWQYRILRDWIAAGAPRHKGSGEVKAIKIEPAELAVRKSGELVQIKVKAHFADGTSEDITPLCDFRSNDDNVAVVSNLGQVNTLRPGDTAIVVSYRGTVLPVRIMVPTTLPRGFAYPSTPEVNYIDREVFAKLKRLNMVPSDLCSDEEFLRRVSIDTLGTLPTAEEVRAFVADRDPKKRSKKIDELLAHPMHAALWATKFSDITGNSTDLLENPQQIKPKLSQMWHDWFARRMQKNTPYDEIVRDVLTATSRDDMSPEEWVKAALEQAESAGKGWYSKYAERKTLDLFWRRQQRVPIDQWGEKTAVAFLGVRIECAQCHKHPFDRWTQADYRAYANLFGNVSVGVSPDTKKAVDEANAELRKNNPGKNNNQLPQLRELFVQRTPQGLMTHPETNRVLTPKALGGPEMPLEPGKDPRVGLWEWMRRPDNPFFARSFANRVWGHYFGVGIVHPVDDFSLANPSSNDKLLDALARDFSDGKYDIRRLERTVLNSRTYQLASMTNETNRLDTRNYSHSYVRPLMAEVVVDVINSALGAEPSFSSNDAPSGRRAIEVGSTRVVDPSLREAFRVFGRSPRTLSCDCERGTEPTVGHKLYLMADPTLQQKIESSPRVRGLASSKKPDAEVTEELFLATLGRKPTAKEQTVALRHLGQAKTRQEAVGDLMWALMNTKEFIFNH